MKTHHHKSSALIGVLCGLFALNLHAADWINTGTGDWFTAGNWQDDSVPADTASIVNGGTALFSGTASLSGHLYVQNHSALLVNAGTLTTNRNYIQGGSLFITGEASLISGGRGFMDNGGQVTVNGNGYWEITSWSYYLYMGDNGTDALLLIAESGSVKTNTSGIRAGMEAGGTSVITVKDQGLLSTGNMLFGEHGTAVLNLDGGTVQVNGSLWLGYGDDGAGLLNIGGDGSGRLISYSSGNAQAILGGDGNGIVHFNHTGDIQFANTITGTNISVEHDSGSTALTADSDIKNLSVSGGILNIDADATLTLQDGAATVSDGGALGGAGILTGGPLTVEAGGRLVTVLTLTGGLTLEAGAILGYEDTALLVTGGTITIGDGILIDFSSLTETGAYTVLNWTGASVTGGTISEDQFNIAGEGIEGTFSVANNQLTFNATAVPEPSTWFLIGAGLGALALIRRRSS